MGWSWRFFPCKVTIGGVTGCISIDCNENSTYDLVEQIGGNRSSVGDIYRAVDWKTGKNAAVRVVPIEILKERKNKLLLRREIKLLSSIKHDNIVKIYGVYYSDNTVKIAFELSCGGEVMRRVLCGNPEYRFCEEVTSHAIGDVALALQYLHARGIAHGDVCPNHFIYSLPDPESKVILADFGHAGPPNAFSFHQEEKLSKSNTTLKFTAPELIYPSLFNEAYAERLDIWSLGVSLYVMLFGSYPFDGKSQDEIKWAILKKPISFPSQLENFISRAAKDLIIRMLSLKPQNRPTASEVLEHPWIKLGAAPSIPFTEFHLSKLREFVQGSLSSASGNKRSRLYPDTIDNGTERPSFVSSGSLDIPYTSFVYMKNPLSLSKSADTYMQKADFALSKMMSLESVDDFITTRGSL